jgi:hypothetical protein
MQGRGFAAAVIAIVACALAPAAAQAASPAAGTLNAGGGKLTYSGTVTAGTAVGGTTDDCFDGDGKPSATSGCDFFKLDVNTPADYYNALLGGVQVTLTGFAPADIDLGIYRRNPDGSKGVQSGSSGAAPGEDERTTVSAGRGAYYLVAVPFAVPGAQNYNGAVSFNVKRAALTISQLNARGPAGVTNYRASHDKHLSHSEPSIAMDPLNHDHLLAGSKMYDNLEKYFFKAGTYESFDGGRTWKDYGQLPGYCAAPGQCDPNSDAAYRVVSDISMAFDDEGNGYAQVLDAPGGATGTGWNMTVHIKRPRQPWTGPITVHDNRNTALTEALLLDDKNWLTVDNNTDVNGGPNRPGDRKIGTMYVCWGYDGATAPTQQIVVMTSKDGGKTWGGFAPGDNTPRPLSQKSVISGIGCQVSVGPHGEAYATWYDNQLDSLIQAKSTDRGASWTPARPVATIVGENSPFEGQSFRNLSIPTTGVDGAGNVYIVDSSANGEAMALPEGASIEDAKKARQELLEREEKAEGDSCPADTDPDTEPNPACSDIVMLKSTNGGQTYGAPVRVNQDKKESTADQFQPWLAITPRGQLNVMYFDRRRDPSNFFIDTYLSRSNNGGRTFTDTRVSQRSWDPRINPPISPSGEFIGDYQGLVADDVQAIPFWNDTQFASVSKSNKEYSPWQEVIAAPTGNVPSRGGPKPRCVARRAKIGARSIGKTKVGDRSSTVARRYGLPSRRKRGVWRYCVRGGGKFIAVFSKRKRVVFLATTARRHKRGRLHPGSRLRSVSRAYHGRGVHRVRGRVLVVRKGKKNRNLVFGVRGRRVRYIAVVNTKLRRSARQLIRLHKRAGFATTRKKARRKHHK